MNTAVKEGQTVEEGDILIQLDDRRQRTATDIAVMASESDVSVEAAEMSSEQAQIDLENAEAAFKANAGSEWEFRRAILERNLSVLRIAAAQLEHQSATLNAQVEKIRLAEYQVRAPFPGYINRVLVDPGSRVTGETEIIEIVDLRTLQAEIMLPVSLYNTVTIGDTYQLTGDVPVSRELQGTLVHASRVIDPASETFRCVFQIENNDNSLPSGFRIWFDAER